MNYGYEPTDKDEELATRLAEMVAEFPVDANGRRCYIEVNGMYPGVRLRRITHYTEEQREQLVQRADQIFREVTGE